MSRGADSAGFASTTFLMVGGPLIFLAAFLAIYVFAAVACARSFNAMRIIGLSIVPLVTTVVALSALVAIACILRRAWRKIADARDRECHQFINYVASGTSAMSLLGVVLIALPSLFVVACPSPV